MKNQGFAIVLLVIAVSAIAVGLELNYRNTPSPSGPTSSTTTATTSSQSLQTTATSTLCSPALPLTLVSVRTGTMALSIGTEPALVMTWSNCADQAVQFNTKSSALKVVLISSGQTSTATAFLNTVLYIQPSTTNTVNPRSTLTVTAELGFFPSLSSNAQVQSVSGTLTATDPVTNQAISPQESFTA